MRVLDFIGFDAQQQAQLKTAGADNIIPAAAATAKDYADLDAIFGWGEAGPAIVKQAPHLRYLQTLSAGVDYLPLGLLAKRQVEVANASGLHGDAIAETVLAFLLAFTRQITFSNESGKAATFWNGRRERTKMHTLAGQSALIYGAGSIGQTIGAMLQMHGVTTYGVNTRGETVPGFKALYANGEEKERLGKVDFVINAMPLTPQTRHFFNHEFFAAMASDAIFVNIGRGPEVATTDLVAALQSGTIAGAGLDVFEEEPLPETSPLWSCPNLVMTPHTSGTVSNIKTRLLRIIIPNLQAISNGKDLVRNRVNLHRGY
ncbi:NAD(P)-dependent oxidoreductase [Lacticaseibacillus zhaodongensis]|uniref:NAD(P)-dependent oxidoreductase n=1 Tax=Lacticaseibacillus zhaodongensis TaxID=2668065 RepID=UPI0012D2F4A2|nr:NAD(P)-dependent oxidoreductase [Lacticaseibacillus zhaodongensis]